MNDHPIEWIPIRVDQDPNVLGYIAPPPEPAVDPATWRAWIVEMYGPPWHTCATCGGPIRPPEQFYVALASGGGRAHVICPDVADG
jgi:hypothetical protein